MSAGKGQLSKFNLDLNLAEKIQFPPLPLDIVVNLSKT